MASKVYIIVWDGVWGVSPIVEVYLDRQLADVACARLNKSTGRTIIHQYTVEEHDILGID